MAEGPQLGRLGVDMTLRPFRMRPAVRGPQRVTIRVLREIADLAPPDADDGSGPKPLLPDAAAPALHHPQRHNRSQLEAGWDGKYLQ